LRVLVEENPLVDGPQAAVHGGRLFRPGMHLYYPRFMLDGRQDMGLDANGC